ncbi:hypothetical protein BC830DRAFT_622931 [Chytriomyces sp. MP71]|nr:hypothetical protein BC830DRAFT_622931 [Chytriomyces sp. MP71]
MMATTLCVANVFIKFETCAHCVRHAACLTTNSLRKKLRPFMDLCPNKNCKVKALCWNINDHLEECQYVKVKCPSCDKMILISSIQSHFHHKYTADVIRQNDDDQSNLHVIELDGVDRDTLMLVGHGVVLLKIVIQNGSCVHWQKVKRILLW